MADRPMIFSAPMVQALLAGRKMQTRRLVTPGTCDVLGSRVTAKSPAWTGLKFDKATARSKSPISGGPRPHLAVPWVHPDDEANGMEADAIYRVDPIISVGDRLYVRENHALVPSSAYRMSEGVQQTINPADRDQAAIYAAGWDRSKPRWRPSIHMPRWASRLTLLVTDVRVERLNEMSPADAIAEGIQDLRTPEHSDFGIPGLVNAQHPVRAFWLLWDSIHGEGAWLRNPWVVAVSFSVHTRNIDQLAPADALDIAGAA